MRKYINLDYTYTNNDLEILISTTNRISLDFLVNMFPFSHFSNFSILIINQTQENRFLYSDFQNIKVINSLEIGLSKSRNLAIRNSVGKLLILADDDVVYEKHFADKIIFGYNNQKAASVIIFCTSNLNGLPFKRYSKYSKTYSSFLEICSVMSIEMTFKKSEISNPKTWFNERFGLGAEFEMGEEAIFLNDLKNLKKQIYFVPEFIVKHADLTTTDILTFEKKYKIYGAFFSQISPNYYYFWFFIKLFFDLKHKKIDIYQIFAAIKFAKTGRNYFLTNLTE